MRAIRGAAIGWAAVGLSGIFVSLRLYVRWWLQRLFTASDIVILITWCLHAAGLGVATCLYKDGLLVDGLTFLNEKSTFLFVPFDKLEKGLKGLYATTLLLYSTLWGIKLALLLLYYNIVPPSFTRLRWALHATAFYVFVGYVCSMVMNIFWCIPIKRNWDITHLATLCFSYDFNATYYTALAFHMTSDTMIYILPFPLLRHLRLSRAKQIGVAFLFSLGLVCILCTAARTVVIAKNGSVIMSGVWIFIEQGVGIMVVCAPALKVLFTWKGKTQAESAPGNIDSSDAKTRWWKGWFNGHLGFGKSQPKQTTFIGVSEWTNLEAQIGPKCNVTTDKTIVPGTSDIENTSGI